MRISTAVSAFALSSLVLVGCTSPAQEQAERQQSAIAAASAQFASASPSVEASADPAPSRVEIPAPNQPQVAEVSKDPSGNYHTKTAYAAVTTTSAVPSPTQSTEAKKTPPAFAYAGADKDAPANAIVLAKNVAGAYAITTPSGNINCQFGVEFEGCGLVSFQQEGRYKDGDTVLWFVRFNGESEPSIVNLVGTPAYMSGATRMEYGTVAKAGDYVCASEDMGMTCWNNKTKRGFFVNRDGFETFNASN